MAEARFHPDIVWEEPADFPDAGTRRGREAVLNRMRERLSLLGLVKFEVVETEEIGERRMYVEVVGRGRGSASGAPAQMHDFWVYDYAADGSVIRWREFLDRDAALAAAHEDAG